MSSNARKYEEIFDYLSAPTLPTTPEAAIVFGRKDVRVAQALGDLIIPSLVETAVITGGIGKDSGDILEQGFRSEAHYLAHELQKDAATRRYQLPPLKLEEKAANGGENARYALDILEDGGTDLSKVTAVAHATSARRLAETLKFEAAKKLETSPSIHRAPSAYEFNPANPADQNEAAAELLRLADWPKKGWLGEQPDLPDNLVDFVRDVHNKPSK